MIKEKSGVVAADCALQAVIGLSSEKTRAALSKQHTSVPNTSRLICRWSDKDIKGATQGRLVLPRQLASLFLFSSLSLLLSLCDLYGGSARFNFLTYVWF